MAVAVKVKTSIAVGDGILVGAGVTVGVGAMVVAVLQATKRILTRSNHARFIAVPSLAQRWTRLETPLRWLWLNFALSQYVYSHCAGSDMQLLSCAG